jgi:hypothetical protein
VGHLDLFILRLDGMTMQFKCAACGTLWLRTPSRNGSLDWTIITSEIKGMSVPGWKARTPSAD